jgi:hypothetical protein
MSIYDLRYTPISQSLSKPYMTFQGSYASDRFGLGFDYDPLLGLIATGTSIFFSFPFYRPLKFMKDGHIKKVPILQGVEQSCPSQYMRVASIFHNSKPASHPSLFLPLPLTQQTAHTSSAASTSSAGHHVSLFSTRTGKIVPSPLNSYHFSTPVTCIQFTNAIRARSNASSGRSSEGDIVGDDGRPCENNEPKSIVTTSGGRIAEWSVQGLGAEDERQE